MSYKLSICIPTYNRAKYLSKTLDSIISQINSNVEIIVCDNCSTDNTALVLHEYMVRYNFIQYIQHNENLGADLNYLSCVSNSNGEYTLIFGSDDILLPNAIEIIFRSINAHNPEYVIFNRNYGASLENIITQKAFDFDCDKLIKLDGTNKSYRYYFDHTTSLLGGFAFIGNVVFKTVLWNQVNLDKDFVGSYYLHVYYHFMAFRNNDLIIISYINKSLTFALGGNDSFYENMAQRMLVDYDGYYKLSNLFTDEAVKQSILKMVVRPYPIFTSVFLLHCILYHPELRTRVLARAVTYRYSNLWLVTQLSSPGLRVVSLILFKIVYKLKASFQKLKAE